MNFAHPYKVIMTFLFAWGTLFNSASASEATIPNTFSAGTPAKAAEVNDNFNAVKSAVDDNHASITKNAGDIATNSSAISQMQEQQSHIYVVNPTHVNTAGEPDLTIDLSGMRSSSLGNTVWAPVDLPQGAIVTDMDCLVKDSGSSDFSDGFIRLVGYRLGEGIPGGPDWTELVYIPLTTSGSSSALQRLVDSDGVVENAEIDNSQYVYAIQYVIRRTAADMQLTVSRCQITYQY